MATNMASKNSNIDADADVEKEIAACLDLDSPRSFFLYAGAGSGKTRSLVNALEYIKQKNLTRLRLRGQQVAVITYTNAAREEIDRRLRFDPSFYVATIHSFAWKLIGGFNKDIREWLRTNIAEEISELKEAEAKGRAGTKASLTRLAQIQAKTDRLDRLDQIKTFSYNPAGDNRHRSALNHSEVIEICASFLSKKPLMQSILVNQHPFLFVDESQDTNKRIVDALFALQSAHPKSFSLGFIGDTMQRIYNDGKERIEDDIPKEWARPAKLLNHRSPERIVRLINKIRSQVDTQQQQARSDREEGLVRLFALQRSAADKPALEASARGYMASATGDAEWTNVKKCKILTIEHHMAARRMGFAALFEPIYAIDRFRTGLLDGSLPTVRFFSGSVLPLVKAAQRDDKFAIARIVREESPLLTSEILRSSVDQRSQVQLAHKATQSLIALFADGVPTCREILTNVSATGLFEIPEALRPFAAGIKEAASAEAEIADPVTEETNALDEFLNAPFSEVEPYADYIADRAEFGTHQGVKGLEFDRVMVVMDDEEARGFMFGYEKLFGAKELTPADKKNEIEGRDNSISRTRRLFYVTCSRARKSLALLIYCADPNAVRTHVLTNGWFDDGEVVITLPK